jgi:hypothetical protein
MSWNAFHSRGETLRAVVDIANERRDGVIPMDAAGVAENFSDELDLVGALLLKWHARLSGNIERAMVLEPMDLEAAVASAWRTTAEQMPGVRLVIDRCVEHPATPEMERAMSRACEREWARLAAAAGLSSGDSPAAVEVGRRVADRARHGLAELAAAVAEVQTGTATDEACADPIAEGPSHRPTHRATADETASFVDRIKAVLAAA